ncbi:MAG: hypothetical protein H7287_07995 [Thermoleophilia bacterium]|nr:hypothetical protein [Thermoleophilia bacterium]
MDTAKLTQGWNQFKGAMRAPNPGATAPAPSQVNVPARGMPEIIRTPQFEAPLGNAAVGTGFTPTPAFAADLPATDMRGAIMDAAAAPPRASRLWGDPNGANPLAMFGRRGEAAAPAAAAEAAVGDAAAATTQRASRLWGNPEAANPFAAFGLGHPAEQVAAQVEPKLSRMDLIAKQLHMPTLGHAAGAAPTAAVEVAGTAANAANPFAKAVASARGASIGEIASVLNFGRGAPAAAEGAGLLKEALGLAGRAATKL